MERARHGLTGLQGNRRSSRERISAAVRIGANDVGHRIAARQRLRDRVGSGRDAIERLRPAVIEREASARARHVVREIEPGRARGRRALHNADRSRHRRSKKRFPRHRHSTQTERG